ncbi:SH2 domain-containing adapter protein D [Pelodytes ibericus]
MAKWLKEYLGFGSKRSPPRPPKPDYTESEVLRAYRAQKNLDFEDPYEEKDCGSIHPRSPARIDELQDVLISPRQRLIKVEQTENYWGRQTRLAAVAVDDNLENKVIDSREYSDPSDMKNTEVHEKKNTGYMEPYEHQRHVTDMDSPVKSEVGKELQLYDCPYEERFQDTFQDNWHPSDDERPANDYDQPWEWKKDEINRAFAVQFEESRWKPNSPKSRDLLLCPKPRGHITCHHESTSLFPKFEQGDINPPLHKQKWYHGTLSHLDAEKLLKEVDQGNFLLHKENEDCLYLSVKGFHSVFHVKVVCVEDGCFRFGDTGPSFPSVWDLIQHYFQNPLLVPGEGEVTLQCPVSLVER